MTEMHLSGINVKIINVCVYVAVEGRKSFLTKLQLSLTGNAVHSIKFSISSFINEVNKILILAFSTFVAFAIHIAKLC